MNVNTSIQKVLAALERRKGITLRRHVTLEDLAVSLLHCWPKDERGKESLVAQKMCNEAMEGVGNPKKARAAFVGAAFDPPDSNRESFANLAGWERCDAVEARAIVISNATS